jgi:hypothetical protein
MIDIKDLRGLERGLDRLREKMEERSKEALADTAVKTFLNSQSLVPVDTGELKASGQVSELVESNDGYSIAISYQAPYAGFVHEDLDANHPHGGQAKYLETPFLQAGDMLVKELER